MIDEERLTRYDPLRLLVAKAIERRQQYPHPSGVGYWDLSRNETVALFTLGHADLLDQLLRENHAAEREIAGMQSQLNAYRRERPTPVFTGATCYPCGRAILTAESYDVSPSGKMTPHACGPRLEFSGTQTAPDDGDSHAVRTRGDKSGVEINRLAAATNPTSPAPNVTDEDVSHAWDVYDQTIDHYEVGFGDTTGLRAVLEDFVSRHKTTGRRDGDPA